MDTPHPWQVTPTELLKQAIRFLHDETEVNRQIAYLLTDVGVETMFKTYLLLPDSITGAKVDYYNREKATESNFHILVETVKEAAEDRITGINIENVKYYHTIRNKLYHQGDGIVPVSTNAENYLKVATELLFCLLDVDIRNMLTGEQKKRLLSKRMTLIERNLKPIQVELKIYIERIHKKLLKILDEEESEYARHSFAEEMNTFIKCLSTQENQPWKSAVWRLINDGILITDNHGNPLVIDSR